MTALLSTELAKVAQARTWASWDLPETAQEGRHFGDDDLIV